MQRTTLNLQQGTDSWLAARASCDGTASEAPAMFGKSKYQTRTDLLNQRKTGLVKDVNAATQAIFNKGHEAEANARPIAEEIIGEELSPVTYMVEVDGLKLIASLDGITFDDSVIWEHKLWNEKLALQVQAGELEEHYTIQLDQELLASGAQKCLFMTSDGTKDKCVWMWYESSNEKTRDLISGWKQFKADLEEHVPPVQIEKVEAELIKALPVPSVTVRGEITSSNLIEITPKFDAYLSSVKTELSTDQDFADAEANAKNCRETAKRIESLRGNIIAQMVTVNEIDGALLNYQTAFNTLGLRLEKAVKDQKESIKLAAELKAKDEYLSFVANLQENCSVIFRTRLTPPDFNTAIKGIRTIESMHSRINDALAKGKIEAQTLFNEVTKNIKLIESQWQGIEHIVTKQLNTLVFSSAEYIELYLKNVRDEEANRKAQLEAEIKARLEAEAKAEQTAKEKLAAEKQAADAQLLIDQGAKQPVSEPTTEAEPVVAVTEAKSSPPIATLEQLDDISAFMKTRDFGKEDGKIRAILTEYVKFAAERNLKIAA